MSEKQQCCKSVYGKTGNSWTRGRHQCVRNASVERDGKWYCKTHDPVARKERSDASYEKFRLDLAETRRKRTLEAAAPALLEALEDLIPYFEGEHHPDHPQTVAAYKAIKLAKGEA